MRTALRILVAGVTGQVGSRLARMLLAANHEVRGTVWDQDPGKNPVDRIEGLDIEIMTGDLANPAFANQAVDGVDAVVHGANMVGPRNYENNMHVNMEITRACGKRADELERLVYLSSSGVFPNDGEEIACAYHPVDELHPKRPRNEYTLSKLMGEMMVQSIARQTGLRTVIVRQSHVLSGDMILQQFTASAVIKLLRRGQKNPQGELFMADGTQLWQKVEKAANSPEQPCSVCDIDGRPWYYQPNDARDVAQMLFCALTRQEAVSEDFNCGSPGPFTFTEGARMLAEISGRDPLEIRLPVRYRYDHAIGKAKALIGYEPQGSLERMMASAKAFRQSGQEDYLW